MGFLCGSGSAYYAGPETGKTYEDTLVDVRKDSANHTLTEPTVDYLWVLRLSVCASACLCVGVSVFMYASLPVSLCLGFCLSARLCVCLSARRCVCLSACMSVCLSVSMSLCL